MTKGFIALFATGFVFLTASAVHTVQGGEHRRHEAHEHGVAHLNVALEGSKLAMELSSPAANRVGCEHLPRTRAQRDRLKEAQKTLAAAQTLFRLPAQAQARLVRSSVDTDIDRDSADASQEKHAHGQADLHDEKEKAGHDHHDDEHAREHHSDFKTAFDFICNKPEKLAYLDVMLFQAFPGIERIEVQILTETGQTAMELTAEDYRITFKTFI